MFGDLEGLERVAMTEQEEDSGVIEMFVENRSEDWFITYYVYNDKCIVIEAMDGNYHHCKEECKDLGEAISVASKWC